LYDVAWLVRHLSYGSTKGATTVRSVLVIGAGIGGLVTAARLARRGYQVTVAEQGERAGGRCDRLLKDGHQFDTGPTLFLMPQVFAQTFADLGQHMEDHLDLRRVDPTYHIHFGDGSTLALTSDLNAMQAQLEAIEPGSFGGFLRYLNEGHLHQKLAFPHLAQRSFYSLSEFLSLKNLLLFLRVKLLTKHYDNMGNYFDDPRLKAAFTFQDMYMSLSPYEAPATFSLFQHTEFADGVWFPMGGMYRLAEALASIAEMNGVRFVYEAPVKQINVDGQQATGVTLADGREILADIVVANADLPYVYRRLLPDDGIARRLERKKYTCSTVTFYWGVDKQYPQFGPHNLFLASNLRDCLDRVLKDLTLPDEPTFYMHTPVYIDPSLAPEGQDTLVVVLPVGHINDSATQDWAAIQHRARQLVLQRLARIGVDDLEAHIKFEVSYTPPDWLSRYNLAKGATFGLGHNLMQMAYLRPQNRHARYRNLYFVGASTHPGSGLPAVLLSARFAAERVLRDVGVP
jgi:phytoene desaturase